MTVNNLNDFHRLRAWVRVEFNAKFDCLSKCATQSISIAEKDKERLTSPHTRTYAVST